MPRKKPETLYEHCRQELVDEGTEVLRDGKAAPAIGEAMITQRVVEYARRIPFAKKPRARKKVKAKEGDLVQIQSEDAPPLEMVKEKGKLVHG